MLLSRAGLEVTLLERQPFVGGRTSTFEADGFKFDLGPTFFLYPRILAEVFSACGRDLRREVEMRRLDPQYNLVFGAGGELACTPDHARMEQAVAALSPGDAGAFARFIRDNRDKFERLRPILQQECESMATLVSPAMRRLLPVLRPQRSLGGELARFFEDPRLQLAFTFQSKYLGMSPFKCPSVFSILSYLEYEFGVFHPVGGCGAVSDAMARVAREQGVDIRLGEPVEHLEFEGKRVTAAITPAGRYPCDALVVNTDAARAMTSLIPERLRPGWTDRKLARRRFSCSTFMLYLGIDGVYDHVKHHTIYIAKDYQRNLDEIEKLHVLSDDPSIYVQNAGVTDPTLAPKGMSTLYVLAPCTHETANVDWTRERERYRRVVLDQLRLIGIDPRDIESRIRYERVFTPADWSADMNIHLGATFNLAHNLRQMLHRRPRNRFRSVKGMYLVGGGTHPGSGLPVIYEGARISARLLLNDLGLDASFLDVEQPPANVDDAAAVEAAAVDKVAS